MSRVSYSIKNVKVSVFFTVLTLIVSFFYRSIFIQCIGDKLVGLTSTIMNILGFFNLAELGLSSAISGTLYSALYLKDQRKIQDIVSIFGYLYRIIGFTIFTAGLIFSIFLPYIFSKNDLGLINIYICFYTFLSTSLVGYFVSYRQTLLIADQKEYIVTVLTNCSVIVKQIIQIIILTYFLRSYILLLLVELTFGLLYGFLINGRVSKHYPELQTSYTRGKKAVKNYKALFRTIKQVMPHKIGAFVLFQTDSILIFAFVSLQMVTLYTNYAMILSKISSLITKAFGGSVASVGNLVAEGDKYLIKKVFNEYNALFFFLGGVICACLFFLVNPFIVLWLGKEYLLNDITFYLFLLNTYIGIARLSVDFFIGGYVLYKDTWAPVAEASINLVASLIFGYFWGIAGILFGTTISLLIIIVLWKPYFLFKEGLGEKVRLYWMSVIKYIILLTITVICVYPMIYYDVLLEFSNFLNFFINGFILFSVIGIIYWLLMYIFDQGTKDISYRVTLLIKNQIKK